MQRRQPPVTLQHGEAVPGVSDSAVISPEQRFVTRSTDIESAQRCPSECEEIESSQRGGWNMCHGSTSEEPKTHMVERTRAAKAAMARALSIFKTKNKKLILDTESEDLDNSGSSDESSESDLEDSEGEGVKEVPIHTFVKNTRIIYRNGVIRYVSATKRK